MSDESEDPETKSFWYCCEKNVPETKIVTTYYEISENAVKGEYIASAVKWD